MSEEVKRCVEALRICHSNEDCRDCKFIDSDKDEMSCVNILFVKAADLIESLPATCDQLTDALKTRGFENIEAVFAELDQVKRERDAAVQDLEMCCPCEVCTRSCKYDKVNAYDECADFEWRGVREKGLE